MKRRTAGRSAKPRVCARCGGLMSADRPVTLVATLDGILTGPYHMGCAERLVIEYRESPKASWLKGASESWGRVITREETLPW